MPHRRRLVTLLLYAAPLLMLAVAARQVWLAREVGLSPWKGGGFGMFASVDSVDARWVRLSLRTPGGAIPIDVTSAVRGRRPVARELRRARTLPAQDAVDEALSALVGARAVWSDCTARHGRDLQSAERHGQPPARSVLPLPRELQRRLGCVALEPAGVDFEVWRADFDRATRRLTATRIARATGSRP